MAAETDGEVFLLLNEAVEKLQQEDPKAAEVVRLRFFGGLSVEEAAEAQRMRPNGHPVPVAPGYPPVVDLDATIVQPALTVVRPSDVPQHRM